MKPMGKTLPYSYRAYGLHLQSALELPELTPYPGWERSGADITIRLGSVAPLLGENEEEHRLYYATAEEVTIAYSGVGRFLIQGGTQIVVDAVPGMEEAELRVYLLGVALAILLHQRGLLVLHASGVSIEGGAVLFLGAKGYGKSTMAAAMQELGHPLIADDVVPISMKSSKIEVYPGFPQLKLWPESVKALGRYPEELPKLYSEVDKRKQVAEHFVQEEVLPLRAIFVLSHGDELRIDTLGSRDAFAELIRHSFLSKFLHEMSSATTHFSQCVRLLEQKPLLYLQRPKKLKLLKEVAQLVEQYAVTSEVVT